MSFDLTVNGVGYVLNVDRDTPLLWVIRDELGLTGTKYGCGIASCGACTVHMDGNPLRSCSIAAANVTGDIVTIEGVDGRVAEAIRSAWIAGDVPQCGYCQSGQIMTAIALLAAVPDPTDRDVDLAMNGNLCRCATYLRIRAAIHVAADALKQKP
jgi:isoquinoline 1-oxidoreductase alpha subunit